VESTNRETLPREAIGTIVEVHGPVVMINRQRLPPLR
jgi:hypothetical protein